jgi:hypothetical protein
MSHDLRTDVTHILANGVSSVAMILLTQIAQIVPQILLFSPEGGVSN